MARKILLADDSITIQKVVEMAFRDAGFEVACLPDAASAMRRMQDFVPDIILADVQMPEREGTPPSPMAGYNFCQAIKQNAATAHIPVLLLRGTFEPWDSARAEAVRSNGSVIKPFESEKLVEQVQQILAQGPVEPSFLPPPEAAPAGVEPGLLDSMSPGVAAAAGIPLAAPTGVLDTGVVSASDWLAENPPAAVAGGGEPAPGLSGAGAEPSDPGLSFDIGSGEGQEAPQPLWNPPPEAPGSETAFGGVFGAEAAPPAGRVDYRGSSPILEDRVRYETPGILDEPPPPALTGPGGLTEEDRRVIVEEIVGRISDQIVREIADRVVPLLADQLIRAKLEEIERKVEGA